MAFRDDPSYAWGIALMPLALLAVVLLSPTDGIAGVGAVLVVVASYVLAKIDIAVLDRKGVGTEVLDGLVMTIPPYYLIQRTKFVGSPAAIPIAWFAALSLSVLVAVAIVASADGIA